MSILWSRPAEGAAEWKPTQGCQVYVVTDQQGVSGFIMLRTLADGILADQVECEYENGKPTERGKVALAHIDRFLHEVADCHGQRVYSIVHKSNPIHKAALERRGYAVLPIDVLCREPKVR